MHEVRRTRRTPRRVSRAFAFLTLIPVFALLLATSASADVTAVGGGAFGESIHVTTLRGAVNSGPLPNVTLPPGGDVSLASIDLPGMLHTGILNASSHGTTGPAGSTHSTASLVDFRVGSASAPTLTASLLSSRCTSNEQGSSGSAAVTSLTIGGVPTVVSTAPNTTVNIPGVGSLTLNEQIVGGIPPASSSITVNSLHLRLAGALGTGDIIIAQSRCSITGNGVVVPSGAIGGVLLTGLVAVVFAVHQIGRSRNRRRDLGPARAS